MSSGFVCLVEVYIRPSSHLGLAASLDTTQLLIDMSSQQVPTNSILFSKQWSTEQEFISGVVLNKSLCTLATPATPSEVPQIKTSHKDQLGNILEFVSRSNFSIC